MFLLFSYLVNITMHLFIYNTTGALLNSRVLKKIPVNKGGARVKRVTGKTGETRRTGKTRILSFLFFLFFFSGAPRPQSVDGRWSSVDQKTQRTEGFCAKRRSGVRSLLGANEELRSLNFGANSTRYMRFTKKCREASVF